MVVHALVRWSARAAALRGAADAGVKGRASSPSICAVASARDAKNGTRSARHGQTRDLKLGLNSRRTLSRVAPGRRAFGIGGRTFAAMNVRPVEPIVSVGWLAERLDDSRVKVLDATWYLPNKEGSGKADFKRCRIPGARYFDIDSIADKASPLPHMLPPEESFAAAMDELKIERSDTVIIYETNGIAFAAARAWWMLRSYGHPHVAVLNGGMPAWEGGRYPLDVSQAEDEQLEAAGNACIQAQNQAPGSNLPKPQYPAQLNRGMVVSKQDILDAMSDPKLRIMDARGVARFSGSEPEIRAGVRSGHIPGSTCVPYASLLADGKALKGDDELRSIFGENISGKAAEKWVATCGSGVTACVIALACAKLGRDVSVYDGSWTEWGGDAKCPVASSG